MRLRLGSRKGPEVSAAAGAPSVVRVSVVPPGRVSATTFRADHAGELHSVRACAPPPPPGVLGIWHLSAHCYGGGALGVCDKCGTYPGNHSFRPGADKCTKYHRAAHVALMPLRGPPGSDSASQVGASMMNRRARWKSRSATSPVPLGGAVGRACGPQRARPRTCVRVCVRVGEMASCDSSQRLGTSRWGSGTHPPIFPGGRRARGVLMRDPDAFVSRRTGTYGRPRKGFGITLVHRGSLTYHRAWLLDARFAACAMRFEEIAALRSGRVCSPRQALLGFRRGVLGERRSEVPTERPEVEANQCGARDSAVTYDGGRQCEAVPGPRSHAKYEMQRYCFETGGGAAVALATAPAIRWA